ncbi:MAG: hypothetical protein HYX51_11605 [Chloroflexi bacterium]|nr:hypothetical protein [Chloroflexota bacterium]
MQSTPVASHDVLSDRERDSTIFMQLVPTKGVGWLIKFRDTEGNVVRDALRPARRITGSQSQ